MKISPTKHLFLISIIILITCCTKLYAKDVTIQVSFEPEKIKLGTVGTMKVEVEGSMSGGTPTIPSIPDLKFSYVQAANNIVLTSQRKLITVSHIYKVKASKAGTYEIPSFEMTIDGKPVKTNSAKLVVENSSSTENSDETSGITLKLSLDRNSLYVGEMVPATISLYVKEGIQGNILTNPVKESDAFGDMNYLTQPDESIERIDNQNFSVIKWKTYITPLKSGTQTLEYRILMNIAMPQEQQDYMHRHLNFFLSSMLAPAKRVEIYTIPLSINILPIPEDGRPKDFTGAIGEFTLEDAKMDPLTLEVGEPSVFKFSVKGYGNFQSISAPKLDISKDWKTYTPKMDFNKADEFGYIGEKAFEYVIIPQSEKILESPQAIFNFFSPKTGKYEELKKEPLKLTVVASSEKSTQPTASAITTSSASTVENEKEDLLPIKLSISQSVQSITPMFLSIKFWLLQLIPVTIILCIYLYKKKQIKLKTDSAYSRHVLANKAVQRNLLKLKEAHNKKKLDEMIEAAENAIQEIIAREHTIKGHALTVKEIKDYLEIRKIDSQLISSVETIFEMGDYIKFSEKNRTQVSSAVELSKLEKTIKDLEKCLTN